MKEKNVSKRSITAEIGLRDRKYLLFVGRLNKSQGVHYLIEAFKQLEDTAKTPNNFKLVIVANENDGNDHDYVKYLSTISQRRDNIIFLCTRKKITIKELISKAYLFVEPSELPQKSNHLLEAMRNGLAPIVSDLNKNREVVGDGGFIFEAKSVIKLRDQLAYLLNRKEVVEMMAKRAKIQAQKYYKQIADLKNSQRKDDKLISEKNKFTWRWKNLLKKCH